MLTFCCIWVVYTIKRWWSKLCFNAGDYSRICRLSATSSQLPQCTSIRSSLVAVQSFLGFASWWFVIFCRRGIGCSRTPYVNKLAHAMPNNRSSKLLSLAKKPASNYGTYSDVVYVAWRMVLDEWSFGLDKLTRVFLTYCDILAGFVVPSVAKNGTNSSLRRLMT